MFQVIRLDSPDMKRYEPFTFRHVRSRLKSGMDEPRLIAIGAEDLLSQPIGLALADIKQDQGAAEVLSLYVDPLYRRFGVATSLLSALEERLSEKRVQRMKLAYYSGKTATPILEAFLRKNGWSPPAIQAWVYTVDHHAIVRAPWVKPQPLPEGMTFFLWSAMTEVERERLNHSDKMDFPAHLSPFKNEGAIEPLNSLVLRVGDEIAGWCIVHRLDDRTLLYDSLFVKPDFRQLGCAFTLLGSSIRLQLEERIPYAMFAVNADNQTMGKIAKRWMEPLAQQISEMRVTYKTLWTEDSNVSGE